jgi:hypothetical protein
MLKLYPVDNCFKCGTFGSLWALVHSWIDIPEVEYTSLRDHFVQFTFLAGASRARRSFLQLIWLACVWVVWTERNHRLLRGSASSPNQLLEKIKLFSFRWLKATNVTLVSNYHSWWSSPLLCLGLDWTVCWRTLLYVCNFLWLLVDVDSLPWHTLCSGDCDSAYIYIYISISFCLVQKKIYFNSLTRLIFLLVK